MRALSVRFVLLFVFLSFSAVAPAKGSGNGGLSEAGSLYKSGNFKEAADILAPIVNGGGSVSADDILMYGKCLEKMIEQINTDAEKKCYRGGGGHGKCMQVFADALNAKYGAGSFEFDPQIIIIRYTGVQFEKAAGVAPKGDVAEEAAYRDLTKQLIGHPSEVLPRVRGFLKKYPSGEWHKKGLLLWARINEDVWWIHRNWAWLLYNWNISDEDLIVRAEPYRQEAIKTYKKIKGGEEGEAAKRELGLLLNYKSDGKIYGIVNESDISGVTVTPGKPQEEKKK